MRHERSRLIRVVALAVIATGMSALILIMDAAFAPALDPAATAARDWARQEATGADAYHAVMTGAPADRVEPAAICRLAPECRSDADCDERCGAGRGKCVHSNCPVRICRCR